MAPYKFEIDTAQNGLEAIAMIKSTEYDLIFMDHMMPKMDGIDATIAIRQLQGTYYQELPIIALTANALVGTKEMFIREGMNDFLSKPIELNKLAQVLLKWLPSSKIVNVMTQDATALESGEESLDWEIEGLNTKQGILSVGGSKDNYLRILTAYYNDGLQKCSLLAQHITGKNISAFRTEIHGLKSTSATIGALELSSLAAKLEDAAQNQKLSFIDENLDDFLTGFKNILQAVRSNLLGNGADLTKETAEEGKVQGEIEYLKENLEDLHAAADMVSISQIEEIMDKLQAFRWIEPITQEFSNIRECLEFFDYDGVLECVLHLKNLSEVE